MKPLLFVLVLSSPNAYAYIDPGSGSIMLQMLIATLVGAGFALKMQFKNIKDKIRNFRSSKKTDANDKDENEKAS